MKTTVAISILEAPDELAIIKAVRPVTGNSLVSIKAAIHERAPLYEAELFLNDFADVADTMRALVLALEGVGAGVRIEENGEPITRDTLWNILEDSDDYRG